MQSRAETFTPVLLWLHCRNESHPRLPYWPSAGGEKEESDSRAVISSWWESEAVRFPPGPQPSTPPAAGYNPSTWHRRQWCLVPQWFEGAAGPVKQTLPVDITQAVPNLCSSTAISNAQGLGKEMWSRGISLSSIPSKHLLPVLIPLPRPNTPPFTMLGKFTETGWYKRVSMNLIKVSVDLWGPSRLAGNINTFHTCSVKGGKPWMDYVKVLTDGSGTEELKPKNWKKRRHERETQSETRQRKRRRGVCPRTNKVIRQEVGSLGK